MEKKENPYCCFCEWRSRRELSLTSGGAKEARGAVPSRLIDALKAAKQREVAIRRRRRRAGWHESGHLVSSLFVYCLHTFLVSHSFLSPSDCVSLSYLAIRLSESVHHSRFSPPFRFDWLHSIDSLNGVQRAHIRAVHHRMNLPLIPLGQINQFNIH